MSAWWNHLLHTPMRELAWYDFLAAMDLIGAFLAAVAGLVWLHGRWLEWVKR